MRFSVFVFLAGILAPLFFGAGVNAAPVLIPSPPQVSASSYILMEVNTGKIIAEDNADERLPPASLTKMMTAYIVEKELDSGRIDMSDKVPVSVRAWKTGGSKMFIKEGTEVSVSDLLRGVIIQSGNDASVALAEFIAGSEGAFVDIMNQQAKLMGMENTKFESATGLPRQDQYSSARDLAILASHIINDYPENYSIYAEKYFVYGGIRQPNRNKLLWRDDRVDGLKTGYTEKAKYCMVASAAKQDTRFVAVVMGTKSPEARAVEAQKLLSYGFRYYETHQLFSEGELVNSPKVWKGVEDSVDLVVTNDIKLTIPMGGEDNLETSIEIAENIVAPFDDGSEFGTLTISYDGEALAEEKLVAVSGVEKAGFFKWIWHSLVLIFSAIF